MNVTRETTAAMIDHTMLKPEASTAQIEKLCAEARENHFASVCVNPGYVSRCAELLKNSGVQVCTVVGFPLGATTSATKAFETREAIANGATEIDMVVNVGRIKSGDWEYVASDISEVVQAAKGRALTKVIIETCLLTDEEKSQVCLMARGLGAEYVKTSTGFSSGGATVQDIVLMRQTVGPDMGVKASGGIRTTEDALAMIEAGASRLGVSAGVAIVNGIE